MDLDSCRISNNSPLPTRRLTKNPYLADKPHKYLYNDEDNEYGYILANENSDLFCYNVMVLNYLYGDNILQESMDAFFEYLNYLEYLDFPADLLECFQKLTLTCDNENPYSLLEGITDSQVYRSKKKVYDCVKRR